MKKILDLGCGTEKVPGSIGVERVSLVGVDVVTDLDSIPYPFIDNCFDEIYLNDVIEHLPNTIKVMEEIYRITKPNGHVFIRVIDWSSSMNADDPQHVRQFTEKTFNFFGTYKNRTYYSSAHFKVISVKKDFNPAVKRFIRIKSVLAFLSRYLNNIIDGLHFDLQAIKSQNQLIELKSDIDLFQILRCPWCIKHRQSHNILDKHLHRVNKYWLACEERSCQRKYPIHNGVPIINPCERDRWIATPIKSLPVPPPENYNQSSPNV